MTDAERDAVRARDRAYRATRKEKDRQYRESRKAELAKAQHERYMRAKAQKRKKDPIAAARRLAERAEQLAQKGYKGKLCKGGI